MGRGSGTNNPRGTKMEMQGFEGCLGSGTKEGLPVRLDGIAALLNAISVHFAGTFGWFIMVSVILISMVIDRCRNSVVN